MRKFLPIAVGGGAVLRDLARLTYEGVRNFLVSGVANEVGRGVPW